MTGQNVTDPSATAAPGLAGKPVIRVAHLLDGRHFGGAEQMVRRLIQGASQTAVEAWAYCLNEGRLTEFLRAEGLRVRVIPPAGKLDPRTPLRLARAARRDRIQVLQAHTSWTHLQARVQSMMLGIPNITTIHSPIAQDENRHVGTHPLRAMVERAGRPWTTHLVSVSYEEYLRLMREEGVSTDRISWIPNGVPRPLEMTRGEARQRLADWLSREGLDPQAFTVAMIAQMRPRKGPEVLLRAFARWHEAGGRGVLILIGDDEFTGGAGYLEALRALAAQLGIAARVRFTGFMADPWRLAAGADLVALPSLFGEGMPLVVLEAMSYGLPLVVSDTMGNRELVKSGQNGWLHPAGADEILAGQLAEAAAQGEATRAKGEAGRREFLEHYTLERILDQYRGLYVRLVWQSKA